MNLKPFFVDALTSALDLGLGTPDDVLRFVTPDVLAQHLPRPLWARLLTACLGAPKVDAQLVVETVGVPNLCEHVPTDLIWSVLSDIATKALGGVRAVAIPNAPTLAQKPAAIPGSVTPGSVTPPRGVPIASTPPRGVPLAPPPPAATPVAAEQSKPTPAPTGALRTSIPAPASAAGAAAAASASLANLDLDDEPSTASRARPPSAQRFRQSQSGLSRMAAATAAARRPQAQVTATTPAAAPANTRGVVRRGMTEAESETETSVEKEWGEREIAVDDEQLVDWQASEETVTGGDALLPRKR